MAGGFVCNGLVPVVIGRAIDEAIAELDVSRLVLWIAVIAVVFGSNMIMTWYGRILMQRAMLTIGHDVRMAVTDRVQDPRGLGGRRRTAGELLSIASSDTQRVADAVFMTVFPVAEIASIVYVGVMMMTIHPGLGIAVLLGGPITVWIAMRSSLPLRQRSSKRQRALARASSMAADVVRGLRTLKGLGAIDTVYSRYSRVSDDAYDRTVEANGAQARLNAITESTGAIYVIVIAVAAGYLAMDGQLSVGDLITAIGLTQFIIMPMTMLGRNVAQRWAPAQASAARILEVLNAPSRFDEERSEVPDLPQGLTVITSEAAPELITANRARVIVAPHQSDLFAGTVASNIHPERERAARALHVASGEDIPGGIDREVGESGRNLSGGQRQRVALARAIAADSEVLVLQDPTTAVDSVTEQTISSRVAEYRGSRPTIVYTTAAAWKAVADQIQEAESVE